MSDPPDFWAAEEATWYGGLCTDEGSNIGLAACIFLSGKYRGILWILSEASLWHAESVCLFAPITPTCIHEGVGFKRSPSHWRQRRQQWHRGSLQWDCVLHAGRNLLVRQFFTEGYGHESTIAIYRNVGCQLLCISDASDRDFCQGGGLTCAD